MKSRINSYCVYIMTTQAQVHSALAYYFDHQGAIDKEIKENSDIEYWKKQVITSSL